VAKIKGTALIGIVKSLRRRRAEAERRLPFELRHYLAERIVAAAWYPEEEYVGLLHAYVDISWQGRGWERVGELAAEETLGSVYKNLVQEGDLEGTVRKLPIGWRNYHDSGTLVATLEPGLVRVEIRDHPIKHRGACLLNFAYFRVVIGRAARVAASRTLRCTADGAPSCVWEYSIAG